MMELYGEILQNLLAGHRVEVTFPDLTVRPEDLLTSVCYRALVQGDSPGRRLHQRGVLFQNRGDHPAPGAAGQ